MIGSPYSFILFRGLDCKEIASLNRFGFQAVSTAGVNSDPVVGIRKSYEDLDQKDRYETFLTCLLGRPSDFSVHMAEMTVQWCW